MKKVFSLLVIFAMILSPVQLAHAEVSPSWRATSSALIPGVGQIMNDDHHTGWGKVKILTMWLIELGAIITTPILASKEGWPIVMAGVGIFALNHYWSANDAYEGAKKINMDMEGAKTR
jgi:hypothetical protein